MIGQRHLGDVKFLVMTHAPENFFRLKRNIVDPYAFGLHAAGLERESPVVIAAGDGEKYFFH
jgi:hypothetical protein